MEVTGVYNFYLVALSIFVAISASYAALGLVGRVAFSIGFSRQLWLFGGAVVIGLGIWSTHFIAMLAFMLPISVSYNVPIMLFSVLVAIFASFVALLVAGRKTMTHRHLLIGGACMAAAIVAMHYTGMIAMKMHAVIRYDGTFVALSIVIALSASIAALKLSFQLKSSHAAHLFWFKMLSATIMGTAIAGMHYAGMKAAHFHKSDMHEGAASALSLNTSLLALSIGIAILIIQGFVLFSTFYQKKVEEKIHYMAFYDELTALPNRRLFERHLTASIDEAKRNNTQLAVMFFDLDRFKIINDTLGHTFGDALLREVAARYSACIGEDQLVARMGGDEFTLLMCHLNGPEEAENMARQIIKVLQQPIALNGHEVFVSTSIGIALYPQDGDDADTLMRHADIAMYWAKGKGKSTYKFYTTSLVDNELNKIQLEQDLRKAIELDQFVVHYQPKIDIATRSIIGMEALTRWEHPVLGLIPPNQFIPLAEETGLIVPIGEKIFKMACKQTKQWQETGFPSLQIAVNVSTRQFHEENFVDMVAATLAEYDIEARYVELEVTETTTMNNVERAEITLQRLKALGVKIGIDDFGTGYSSLGYLKTFPIHTLKVDQSFVRDMAENPHNEAIVASIISLAKHMNLTIVAEGVETEDQFTFLEEHGCTQAQGYLFSKPVPPAVFEELLQQRACYA
ncbi:EAL domain-containing protein [Aneurinibacillus sp. BA2021]|nr:EAL domain-containing protein [Aneurinibacillus sp. BA2021]